MFNSIVFSNEFWWAASLIFVATIFDICQHTGRCYNLNSEHIKKMRMTSILLLCTGVLLFGFSFTGTSGGEFWTLLLARTALLTLMVALTRTVVKIIHLGYILHFRWHII